MLKVFIIFWDNSIYLKLIAKELDISCENYLFISEI